MSNRKHVVESFNDQLMKIRSLFAITAFLFIFSCKPDQEQNSLFFTPEIVEARGDTVQMDSLAKPRVIRAMNTTITPAGKPRVVRIKSNVHPAGIPKVVIAGVPRVWTPGKDSFSFPDTFPAIDSPYLAGIPEVVIAEEASTNVQNPHNFRCFSKQQGLKSGGIASLLEDKNGNLWIATDGAGASRYDGNTFTHFTVKEGMSDNSLFTMLEDKAGNLWFGGLTQGVSRYDGKRFTRFTQKDGLLDNLVRSMIEDANGHLWFGSSGGLTKYDGKTFMHFTEKQGLRATSILSIQKDRSGNLWFGTHQDGVMKYDGKTFSQFTEKEGLSDNSVLTIYEDKAGHLWFGTKGGVTKYDRKTFTQFTKKEGLSDNVVVSIEEDKNGNLWFGTYDGGANKYDEKFFTWFRETEGLPNNRVKSILKDKRGNLWFGTAGGGFAKYGGDVFTHFTVHEGLSDNFIRSILEDANGDLWFGTWKGGVNKYDGKSFSQLTSKQGLPNIAVVAMVQDSKGDLWFGDYLGLTKYDGSRFTHFTDTQGLSGIDVFNILEDKSGNLWIGTVAKGVHRYDGTNFTHFTQKEGLTNDNVYNIAQDDSGDLWFGTFGGGLNKYNGKKIIRFTEKGGLKDNNITSLLVDRGGNLWIGSLNGGASRYDGKHFIHFTEEQGLGSNHVKDIFEDKSGNFWFGTSKGLSKLDKSKLDRFNDAITDGKSLDLQKSGSLFRTYTHEDGFSDYVVNFGKTIYEAKDGTIWIGTEERLSAFHPGAETTDTIPPNIQLTALSLFNEKIAWQNLDKKADTNVVMSNGMVVHDFHFDSISRWYGLPQQLSLAYNNNDLTFHFSGITIHSPGKVKYQVKLEGRDKSWSALTGRAEAQYGNLPHGKYIFKVKAMNGDGYWSEELHYPFTLRPPWWNTWAAYTSFVIMFAGLIYALFRYRLDKERKQHEIKQKTAELEMQVLRAQMNPHFIFNSLNSINLFILENNKRSASEYLSKFSRLVRLILNNSQKSFIPLEDELEALRLYLELESLRFEQSFHYKITIEDDLDVNSVKIPPLIIQPYAENAIWHGLMHKKEQGNLEIGLHRDRSFLFCKITDDGIGRKKAAELKRQHATTFESVGMRITGDRIAILQDSKEYNDFITVQDLINADGSPGGTEVILKIPVLR